MKRILLPLLAFLAFLTAVKAETRLIADIRDQYNNEKARQKRHYEYCKFLIENSQYRASAKYIFVDANRTVIEIESTLDHPYPRKWDNYSCRYFTTGILYKEFQYKNSDYAAKICSYCSKEGITTTLYTYENGRFIFYKKIGNRKVEKTFPFKAWNTPLNEYNKVKDKPHHNLMDRYTTYGDHQRTPRPNSKSIEGWIDSSVNNWLESLIK